MAPRFPEDNEVRLRFSVGQTNEKAIEQALENLSKALDTLDQSVILANNTLPSNSWSAKLDKSSSTPSLSKGVTISH
jgi:hypothetical protein